MAYDTSLKIVNNTPFNVVLSASVDPAGTDDWDGDKDRPDKQLKHRSLAAFSSTTVPARLNMLHSSAPFKLDIELKTNPPNANPEVLSLNLDQYKARRTRARHVLELAAPLADKYRVVQAVGDDNNTIHISRKPPPGSDWMAHLSGHLLLSQLTLPGTHDTGTWKGNGGASTQCQTLDIQKQLAAGIRFLDMRCAHVNNALSIHHANAFQDQWLGADVLPICLAFLRDHPGETIVMSIKHERSVAGNSLDSGNTRGFAASLAATFPPEVYTHQRLPRLGEVRGKIVLFRRYEGIGADGDTADATDTQLAKTQGINATNWPDDSKPFHSTGNGVTIQVQDAYGQSADSIADKVKLVEDHLNKAKNGSVADWFINFTSASGGGTPDHFASGASSAEDGVNDRVLDFLMSQTVHRFGTVVMDFPESPAVDRDPAYPALPKQLIGLNHAGILQGAAPLKRPNLDTYPGATFALVGLPLTSTGKLVSWRFFAASDKSVQLIVYRMGNDGSLGSVVCQSNLVTASTGINDINLSDQALWVERGDILGFLQTDGGVIPYDLEGASSLNNTTGSVRFTPGAAGQLGFQDSSNRTYSLQVLLDDTAKP